MAEEVFRRFSGLFTDPNPLTDVPEGALMVADNCVIRSAGSIEPRPGFKDDPNFTSTSGYRIVRLIPFQNDLVAIQTNGSLWKVTRVSDSTDLTRVDGGSWSFTVGEIDHTVTQDSLYIASSDGVFRLGAITDASLQAAGLARPIANAVASEVTPSVSNGYVGWTPSGTSNYRWRVLFVRRLPNGQVVRSARSSIITGITASADRLFGLFVFVPSGIQAGDSIEVYRTLGESAQSAIAEEYFLSASYEIESGDVTQGYKDDIYDQTPENGLGAALYTNVSQEGALQENGPIPLARRLTSFNGMTFYGAATQPHRLILGLKNLSAFQVITANGTFTSGSPNITGVTYPGTQGDNVTASCYVYDETPSNTTGPEGTGTYIPANTQVSSFSGGAAGLPTTIVMNANAKATGTADFHVCHYLTFRQGSDNIIIYAADLVAASTALSGDFGVCFTDSAVIEDVVSELATIFNFRANQLFFGQAEELAAQAYWAADSSTRATLIIEANSLTGDEITVEGTGGVAWDQEYETGITERATSERDGDENRVYISKDNEQEHVPVGNSIDLGSQQNRILAQRPNRDSLFVFTTEGVFQISGDTPADILVREYDQTLILAHPDGTTLLNNQVYVYCNQGLVSLDETGVTYITRSLIEVDIRDITRDVESSAKGGTYPEGCFVEANQVGQYVLLALPSDLLQEASENIWHLSDKTKGVTRWPIAFGCAAVAEDGLLYLGGDEELRVERTESGSGLGPSIERDYSVTINGTPTATNITVAGGSGWSPSVGDVLEQSSNRTVVTVVNSATDVDVKQLEGSALSTGAATAYEGFDCTVGPNVQTANAAHYRKHYSDMQLQFDDIRHVALVKARYANNLIATTGDYRANLSPVDTSQRHRNIKIEVPHKYNRCTLLEPSVIISSAGARWSLIQMAMSYLPESKATKVR